MTHFLAAFMQHADTYPHLAIAFSLLIFAAAFIESFIIIGYVIPATILFYAVSAFAMREGLLPHYFIFMALGGFTADIISYFFGKKGMKFMGRYIEKKKDILDKAKKFFDAYGMIGIIIGKNIGFVRPSIGFIAGTTDMELRKFAITSAVASIIWPLQYFFLSYFFKRNAAHIYAFINHFGGFIIFASLAFYILRQKERPSSHPDLSHLTEGTKNRE